MNIRSSITTTTSNTTSRFSAAKKQFEKAEADLQSKTDEHFANIEKYNRRDTTAATIGGVLGFGAALTLFLNGQIQHGVEGAIPLILGVAGFGGVSKLVSKHMVKKTTLPTYQNAHENYVSKREEFRDALLGSIGDQGVSDATSKRWGYLKEQESFGQDSLFLMDPTETVATGDMRKELSLLEELSQARNAEGWLGKLANLEDNPKEFAAQRKWLQQHPNVTAILENKK